MSTIDSHSSSTRNHTLMQDSAFYRSVFELVADALLLLRLDDGTIIDANPAASVLFGYEREDLVGREVEEFSVDPEATRAAIRAHAEYVAERVYRRKDGSTISVEITSKIIRLNSVLVALASFRDISPRLHQEAELRERERRHATLLANLPGIAYRCRNDRQWTMEFISEGCLALTGYQPRDFIENATLSYNDLIFPEDQDWLWNKWQTVLARRDVFRDEYRILTKTNEIKWVWEQGQGVFDASGNLLALEGFITDITVRKQAELVISQSEERLNAAQRISKTGSWERDLVLGFEHWTRELYRILDRDPALTVPSEQIFIEHVVSEDRDAVARVLREATMSTTDFSFECRIATQRKQIKQVRIDGWIHRDEDGNPVRSGGVVQDITEFHRIRESLRLHAEQLARSSASRDRLYSIIAHDLRSPFSGLLGFSELLLEDFANLSKDVMYSYVANIHRSSRQVYSLVENLLYWSRLHTDRMEMRPEPVHLASAVEDVINVHHGIAIRKSIALRWVVDESLSIVTDRQLLRIVLMNLVSNAIKFTHPNGRVSILAEADENGNRVIRVIDTGIGIPPERMEYLFDPNSHSSTRGTDEEPGTGLGLHLCRDVMNVLGGTITAQSIPDEGSTFVVTLRNPAE